MGSLQSGGGTSAVAASAHAGCRRFRLTDSFLTHKSRKALAEHLGAPDTTAGIPEARWMRAMTFERLVHDERFVSELLTKTIGQLGLARSAKVARSTCNGSVDATAKALADADLKATFESTATMITALGVPYLFLEDEAATSVLPDFAIVAPRAGGGATDGSWLILGDAKDYERIRSKIDDARMLKGFLQVALAAESAAEWSRLPNGMRIHPWGALAVPRNAFLQPEAVVELLDDHRAEVRGRALERHEERRRLGDDRPSEAELLEYVEHLEATFDPASCVSCNLYSYCRSELRSSSVAEDVLIEIGVPPRYRAAVSPILDGHRAAGGAPVGIIDLVTATVTGRAVRRPRPRTDTVGLPGTIFVGVAKSDAAALGIYGITVRRPAEQWSRRTFLEPQTPLARRAVMESIGAAIQSARNEGALPIHLVVPDAATADLLVSAADSVAGVELSRMRWQRDLDANRPALTFDGTPAKLADPLNAHERLGVSFLLEADRSRALLTRTLVVDLRRVLASYLTPGGPAVEGLRLDYLLEWAFGEQLSHRDVSDSIANTPHTPGARLANVESDAIHAAYRQRSDDPDSYRALILNALAYKESGIDRAEQFLGTLPDSRLRSVFEQIEADSQNVWWRRVDLQASDLVRFSRTTEFWRNAQVNLLGPDAECAMQLEAMSDPAFAHDRALDAGAVELSLATVIAVDPIRLEIASRHFTAGEKAVALHQNEEPLIERPTATCKVQGGSFKFGQLSIGELTDDGGTGLAWHPPVPLPARVGDTLILAKGDWFDGLLANGHELKVVRPPVDQLAAPKATCTATSYATDPTEHRWCCRPHSAAEAETSDYLAAQRSAGLMNPEVWPPLVDEERFDVGDDPPADLALDGPPADLTADDLD